MRTKWVSWWGNTEKPGTLEKFFGKNIRSKYTIAEVILAMFSPEMISDNYSLPATVKSSGY